MHRRIWVLALMVISAVGCGSSGGDVDQKAVALVVKNVSAKNLYLDYSVDRVRFQSSFQKNGSFEPSPFEHSCMAECSPDNAGKPCCMQCEAPFPAARLLKPGESVTGSWTGRLYLQTESHCSENCRCYQEEKPAPGKYRLETCAADEVTCGTGVPCPDPDQAGIVVGGQPAGNQLCARVDFVVPYSKENIEIDIP